MLSTCYQLLRNVHIGYDTKQYFLGVVYVIVVFIRAHLSYIFTMKTPSCTSRSEVIESSSARKPSVSDVSKRSIGTSSLENIIDMLRLIVWYGSHWYEHI
uniref:Uncharacterized protein n=1 Tax=Glossina palpalis gambiensis TaxID=67801 RepID=A0A1B0BBL9_9MUSC